VKIFVAGHTPEMLSTAPRGSDFEAVDLRSLTVAARFAGNAFAESRFLVSDEARCVRTDYVGFCSANYDKKFPRPPHLNGLPRLARYLHPGDGLGPALAKKWPNADGDHPGMTAVLQRVAVHFGLTVVDQPVPWANTFVCHRDEWFRLLDAFQPMLTAVLDWYDSEPPYRYRCRRCGAVTDTGCGRYTNARHIAYLGERLTMLHFAARTNLRFFTPPAFRQRTSGVRRARTRLHTMMKARGLRVPRPHFAPSINPLDGPPCPRCKAQHAPAI
jgi:hypothetical protein